MHVIYSFMCTVRWLKRSTWADSSDGPQRAQMLNLNGYKQDFTIFDQRKLLANTVNDDVVLSR